MAWSPVEYMEVAVPVPYFLAVVGDRYVVSPDYVYNGSSKPGNVPRFTVAVMDATLETAELYSGVGWSAEIGSTSSYAWISSNSADPSAGSASNRSLIKFDPSTGSSTAYTAPTLTQQTRLCATSTHIWLFNASSAGSTNIERFKISTSTWDTAFSGSNLVSAAAWDGGGYVYVFLASSVIRYDVSSGSTTTVTPSGYQTPAGVNVTRDPYGVLWYYVFNKIYRWNPGASYTAINPGVAGSCFSGCYGNDGFVYFVPDGSNKLVACDLAGASSGSYTLSPSRASRQSVAYADGRLCIPAGAPYTR